MPDRRSFLTTLGAGVAALAAGGCRPRAEQAAEQSAGQTAGQPGRASGQAPSAPPLDRLGVQLYTLRGAMQQDMPGTLARVAQIGYREVEFAGYFDRTPEQVREMLDRNQLQAPAGHVPIETLSENLSAALDASIRVGHRYLVIPWLPVERRRTIEDYQRVSEQLNRAGEEARRRGVRLAYHNHDFEFEPIGGRIPFDVMLAETDPENVTIELDIYWIVRAGHDPVAYFDAHPNRFSLVHVKDSAGPPEHRMTDVGAGSIDFRRVLGRAEQVGVEHYFVEHDNPADPFESIAASYRHLRTLAR